MRTIERLTVQTDARGRLLLPPRLRERVGLGPKARVVVEVRDDGSIVVRDPRAERRRQLARARGSFRGRGGSVDDLIALRRDEAAREDEDGR